MAGPLLNEPLLGHGQDAAELSDSEIGEIDQNKFVWFVYWYEVGYYDGDGEAVALGKDGGLYHTNLSHCSCYGPMENWNNNFQSITKETVLSFKDDIHDLDFRDEIKEKVKVLLVDFRE